MASFSVSMKKGQAATMTVHEFTEGTLAPNADSIELRIDLTTESITRRDILLALDSFENYFRNLGEIGIAGLPGVLQP